MKTKKNYNVSVSNTQDHYSSDDFGFFGTQKEAKKYCLEKYKEAKKNGVCEKTAYDLIFSVYSEKKQEIIYEKLLISKKK